MSIGGISDGVLIPAHLGFMNLMFNKLWLCFFPITSPRISPR